MSKLSVSLATLNGEPLVSGRLVALVVAIGNAGVERALAAIELGDDVIPDGAPLRVTLLDGTAADAPRLGSGDVVFFRSSGARVLLECLVPAKGSIDAVLQLGCYDPEKRYLGPRCVATLPLGAVAVAPVAAEPAARIIVEVLRAEPRAAVDTSRNYELHVTSTGTGFEMTRSVNGVDYKRDVGDLAISDELLSAMLDQQKQTLDLQSRAYVKSLDPETGDPLSPVPERARKHCYEIAKVGAQIYDEILWKDLSRNGSQLRAVFWKEIERLPEGARLRIHNDGLVIPWNIIYDRRLPARAEDFTAEHIEGFWGYRYRIEEQPNLHAGGRFPVGAPAQRTLCAYVDPSLGDSDEAIRTMTRAHRDLFEPVAKRARRLTVLPRDAEAVLKGEADPLSEVLGLIGPPQPMHLLYFLCHATSSRTFSAQGVRDLRQGTLQLGPAHAITQQNIKKWADDWAEQFNAEPIVFLNCCEAAGMDPFGFGGLVEGFLSYLLASAVVGCSWEVPMHFAHGFARRFFEEFLNEPSSPLGDALYNLRRELLREHLNPFGLTYAVFGNAGVRLAPLA